MKFVIEKLSLLLLIVGILMSCSTPVVIEEETKEITVSPDHESWDVKITITNAGMKRAYISADHLEQFSDDNITLFDKNVKIDFFNTNEQRISNLSADFAEINERTNFLKAQNNVIVESDSGVTLYTDTLSWDNIGESIFTDDAVMITTASNDTLYGIGFESDVNMEHWKILKPRGVTGR